MDLLRLSKLLTMILVPVFGALYVYQFSNQSREVVRPFEPVKALALNVRAANGSELTSKIPLSSPVTLVNFWATNCPPCVEEFPSMLELQRLLGPQGLKIVFVSVDENWADVEAFMTRFSIRVPDGQLFWDPKKEVSSQWGSEKFPETYVVRSDTWIVEKIIGQQDWTRPAVMSYFKDLLAKFADLTPETKIN
jgi:cytochrome c biogenesis protein CcmG/thiol:disulfide interchange protein DsbE